MARTEKTPVNTKAPAAQIPQTPKTFRIRAKQPWVEILPGYTVHPRKASRARRRVRLGLYQNEWVMPDSVRAELIRYRVPLPGYRRDYQSALIQLAVRKSKQTDEDAFRYLAADAEAAIQLMLASEAAPLLERMNQPTR